MKLIGRLIGLIWVVAFGSFMVLHFLPKENQPVLAIEYAVKFEEYLQGFLSSIWFFVFFVAMWVFVSFKLGKDSGWKNLAKYFSAAYADPKNSKFVSGSGYIGTVSHNGMLKVCADEAGFYIKAMFPFNFGHKPLLIPWDEMSYLKLEKALTSNKAPDFVKSIAALFTRKKYMRIELHNFPDQNILIHWEDGFSEYVPHSLTIES